MKRKMLVSFLRVSGLTLLCLSLSLVLSLPQNVRAEDNEVIMNLDTAVYSNGSTTQIGNCGLGTYDTLTLQDVNLSIKELSLSGTYSKHFDWNCVTVRIIFDDNSMYSILSLNNSGWYSIPIGEGKLVKSIKIFHGLSGVVYSAESLKVRLNVTPVYSLKDSSPEVDPVLSEGSSISNDLIYIRNDTGAHADFAVNAIVDSVTVIGNVSIEENEKSANTQNVGVYVKFYREDGSYESATINFDKNTASYTVEPPAVLKGKVISKVSIGYTAGWAILRKVDIATKELAIESIKATPAAVTFTKAGTKQLQILATYSDKSTKDITSDSNTEYDVDDSDVVTVSSKGLIKTTAYTKNGDSAVITISNGDSDTTVKIKISYEDVKSLKPSTSSVVLSGVDGKNSKQLKIKAILKNGTQTDVTKKAEYSSSNTNYFTVSTSGLLTVNSGTPKGKTGIITVKYGGKTCKIDIKVK